MDEANSRVHPPHATRKKRTGKVDDSHSDNQGSNTAADQNPSSVVEPPLRGIPCQTQSTSSPGEMAAPSPMSCPTRTPMTTKKMTTMPNTTLTSTRVQSTSSPRETAAQSPLTQPRHNATSSLSQRPRTRACRRPGTTFCPSSSLPSTRSQSTAHRQRVGSSPQKSRVRLRVRKMKTMPNRTSTSTRATAIAKDPTPRKTES